MVPDPHVQLHPDLARRLGIAASDMVELRTRRGAAVFRAQITDAIRPEVLFTPFHWGGASNANALTDPALDPLSRMPEFKVCAVDRAPRRRPGRHRAADHRSRAARRIRRLRSPPTSPDRRHRRIPTHDRRPRRAPACTRRTASCRASTRSGARASTSPPRCTPS